MKFSELWLREWVNITLNSESLLNQMAMAGLEVGSIEPVSGIFHGVVVGEVVDCSQHPNIDNLRMTKVNIGKKCLLNIGCDALNCRKWIKVAVATVGAVLPGDFKIKSLISPNQVYEGMLCSYSHLNISNDHTGIIELPIDAPIGSDIRDYLKLNDNIIEIRVTPNRSDLNSLIGIARDIAAMNNTELNLPEIIPVAPTIRDILPIQVEDKKACPRYLARVVKDINIKALTPIWMKEKLRRSGIRSINSVLDVINYVLLELGQPMQAFDKDLIIGGILVRSIKETKRLVIADYKKILSMAGIFDSKNSNINDNTKNIVLESALFNLTSIKGHGLYKNNSNRWYDRGIDPTIQHKAMERATRLLIDISGGEAGPIIDITNDEFLPKRSIITLRRSKLDRLIGYHITDMQVIDILHRLGCIVTKSQDSWHVISPSWRFDIKIEEDLVEEVIRIYGYDNIPHEPIQANLIMKSHREADLSMKRVKTLLNDIGYQEVITYSFVDPNVQQLIHPGVKALILPRPISREMSVMRLSLLTGLLKTIVYNQNRQQSRVRIFEIGLRFVPNNLNIRQEVVLGGAICGDRYAENWGLAKIDVDFYDMKGDLESIFDLTGKLSEIKFCAEKIPALHPGQSAAVYLKYERIGFIGVLHPDLERKLGLNGRTIVFELEWNKIPNCMLPLVQEVSKFPANRRDISIVVAENIPASDILEECKKVSIKQIVNINLFSVYRGKGIAKGFKSLAISLILQDTTRTLEEEEISATVTKCVEALKERFQASLRD